MTRYSERAFLLQITKHDGKKKNYILQFYDVLYFTVMFSLSMNEADLTSSTWNRKTNFRQIVCDVQNEGESGKKVSEGLHFSTPSLEEGITRVNDFSVLLIWKLDGSSESLFLFWEWNSDILWFQIDDNLTTF